MKENDSRRFQMDQQNQTYNPQPQRPPYAQQFDTAPIMTVGNWIVTYLIMIIPLVNIIMLIVWAASSTENPNRKNWAIAMLIWYAISIVLMIVLWGAIAAAIAGLANSMG
jgi:ABC-type sugar transport system permease subunit